jgi:hypothetical protein
MVALEEENYEACFGEDSYELVESRSFIQVLCSGIKRLSAVMP